MTAREEYEAFDRVDVPGEFYDLADAALAEAEAKLTNQRNNNLMLVDRVEQAEAEKREWEKSARESAAITDEVRAERDGAEAEKQQAELALSRYRHNEVAPWQKRAEQAEADLYDLKRQDRYQAGFSDGKLWQKQRDETDLAAMTAERDALNNLISVDTAAINDLSNDLVVAREEARKWEARYEEVLDHLRGIMPNVDAVLARYQPAEEGFGVKVKGLKEGDTIDIRYQPAECDHDWTGGGSYDVCLKCGGTRNLDGTIQPAEEGEG